MHIRKINGAISWVLKTLITTLKRQPPQSLVNLQDMIEINFFYILPRTSMATPYAIDSLGRGAV